MTSWLLLVALRKESVDRNFGHSLNLPSKPVALRKESVDRNALSGLKKIGRLVALRKESVDRNFFDVSLNYKEVLSLSARRAWIEMPHDSRKVIKNRSLSARRAWIEMQRDQQPHE